MKVQTMVNFVTGILLLFNIGLSQPGVPYPWESTLGGMHVCDVPNPLPPPPTHQPSSRQILAKIYNGGWDEVITPRAVAYIGFLGLTPATKLLASGVCNDDVRLYTTRITLSLPAGIVLLEQPNNHSGAYGNGNFLCTGAGSNTAVITYTGLPGYPSFNPYSVWMRVTIPEMQPGDYPVPYTARIAYH